ncbi:hypothetical protein AMS68_000754 [Peltaster fructicola]|uniref:SPRY domain-containing protein n=1 Tax=Peltaster fructicola TaxID=286661 RepID=A0A6H0XKG8_9PEZI|nr:hypothetical protein AMS68_000754 [Peltaster fructicola]
MDGTSVLAHPSDANGSSQATAPVAPRSVSKTPAPTAAPIQREQREKKDSLKKREASSTSTTLGKRKAQNASITYPSPQRFAVPPPRAQDFERPKEDVFSEHEPVPFVVPGSNLQLYKPQDLAENKRGYRYQRAIADPLFPHKQFYRCTSPAPHAARLSFEDSDKSMHFSKDALITTNEKGWRMARGNVCAREGTLYYEIKIHKGIPATGPLNEAVGPAPHVRFGWARREAPLDAPVGFDGYSYGLTDMRFETMHRSRPGRFFHSKKGPKPKGVKLAPGAPTTITLPPEHQHVKEGDVIGVEIQLPSLNLHQKIVSGVYNPAVDIGDGFEESETGPVLTGQDDTPADVIRDRIAISYKSSIYFEILDYVSTKPMENYADRTQSLTSFSGGVSSLSKDAVKSPPNPNHEHIGLRTLPHSAIRVYKNGMLIGTAFENLLAFLPPASQPSKQLGARDGNFDDGLLGYFPAVACFFGGIAEVNFGDGKDGFWAAPPHIRSGTMSSDQRDGDVEMSDGAKSTRAWFPGSTPRAAGERYKEQIAEDVVYDLVDEVDFFMQDGGVDGKVGQGQQA